MVDPMFNGNPIIEQVSPSELRITGITLDPDASFTIGFDPSTGGDLNLPASFAAPSVTFMGQPVRLQAAVKVDINPDSVGPFTNLPPSVEKFGDTAENFRIRITNTNVNLVTQKLEIYLTLLGAKADRVIINVVDSPNATVNA